jgi:flagellin-specific chaperone FliS
MIGASHFSYIGISYLNPETGGDFAKKLSQLYSYFIEKIAMADSTQNARELEDIIPIVNDIKEAQQHSR